MSLPSVDPQVTYFTEAKVLQLGRAVVICLQDAKLPGTAKSPHMTVLFRKTPDWSKQEVNTISAKAQEWITSKYGACGESVVPFTIASWGKSSVKILGDLYELCELLRNEFSELSPDKQRLPHCALFEERDRRDRGNRCGRGGRGERGGPGGRGLRCGHGHGPSPRHGQDKMKARLEKRLSKVQHMEQKRLAQIEKLGLESQHLRQRLQQLSSPAGEQAPQQDKKKQQQQPMKQEEIYCNRRQRKLEKQQKKLEKQQKKLQLKKLPKLKGLLRRLPQQEESLKIYIDGDNLMRCFKQCRRERHRGHQGEGNARQIVLSAVQSAVSNLQSARARLSRPCQLTVGMWFQHSSGPQANLYRITLQSIDVCPLAGDLIDLGDLSSKDNQNVVFVTCDRALGLRMQQAGAQVMRSGVFFRAYIKRQPAGVDPMDEDRDEEKEDSGFVKVSRSQEGTFTQPGAAADGMSDGTPESDETPESTETDETPDIDCDEGFTPIGKNDVPV